MDGSYHLNHLVGMDITHFIFVIIYFRAVQAFLDLTQVDVIVTIIRSTIFGNRIVKIMG